MTDCNFRYDLDLGGGGGVLPYVTLTGWFLGCFVLNGVSISSLSVLIRVSLHDLMA